MRFPLEVFDAIRAALPADTAVGVRISATDWVDGGWDIEQSVAFARELQHRGCAFIDVSSGGLSPLHRSRRPGLPGTVRRAHPHRDRHGRRSRWASSPSRPRPRQSFPQARPTWWHSPAPCCTTRAGPGTRRRNWARRCVPQPGARSRVEVSSLFRQDEDRGRRASHDGGHRLSRHRAPARERAGAQLFILLHGTGGHGAGPAAAGRCLAARLPPAAFLLPEGSTAHDPGVHGRQCFSIDGITNDNGPARVATAMPALHELVRQAQDRHKVMQPDTALVGFFLQGADDGPRIRDRALW